MSRAVHRLLALCAAADSCSDAQKQLQHETHLPILRCIRMAGGLLFTARSRHWHHTTRSQ
jgi:hypothetical protein